MRHLLATFLLLASSAYAELTVKPPRLPAITSPQLASGDLLLLWDGSADAMRKFSVSQADARWGGEFGSVWGAISGTLSNQSDLQSALNAKQASGNYLTALTGDVSANGPGSSAATVNTVGGASAANIASATTLANAATSSNTNSAIVRRDSSGNFSAGTVTAALSGNATTATSLASNPTDCSAGQYANAIAANGNLTCADPFSGLVESYSGHIETAANKTYVIDEYSAFAKQITNIRVKCASGTITAALQIGGSNITTCNGISVTSSAATTTCDTGSTNDLAANGRLTLVTTSNSSCLDLTFTIKTTRD